MATDRSMPSPDLAMSSPPNDSPYTIQMKAALRNANPILADTLLQTLDATTRKQSHTPDQGGGFDGVSASASASAPPSSSTDAVSSGADAVLPQPSHVPPPTPVPAAGQRTKEASDGAIDDTPGYPQQEPFSASVYRPFGHPRESALTSGLSKDAVSRLPEREEFEHALTATGSRYAAASDPELAFATNIVDHVERHPTSLSNTVRIQKGFGAFARPITGSRMSTADTVALQPPALASANALASASCTGLSPSAPPAVTGAQTGTVSSGQFPPSLPDSASSSNFPRPQPPLNPLAGPAASASALDTVSEVPGHLQFVK